MLECYLNEQPRFIECVKKLVKSNKISQAYLIETKNYRNADAVVLAFAKYLYCSNSDSELKSCSDCNLCQLIDQQSNTDFIQIRPQGTMIKKGQILEIKERFKTTSLMEGFKRIYIVYEAEKMNHEAANCLLKFLEEPESNIIAILVTENRYKMIDTILSRCQILSFENKNMEFVFSNFDLIAKIIRCLEQKGRQAIAYLPIVLEHQYYSREQWIQYFIEIQYIYEQTLRKLEGASYLLEIESILNEIQEKNTEHTLLYKLETIYNQINDLEYNLNVNLMLDSFIIKFNNVI